MNRLTNFVRSDLFLSLIGGFALGLAGLAFIKPATAESRNDQTKSVTVETPDYAQSFADKRP
jgi:hypothetical protein